MSSDLERLAEAVRAVSRDAHRMTAELSALSGDIARLAARADALSEPRTTSLVAQLQLANVQARAANAAIAEVGRHGDRFADELCAGPKAALHPIRDGILTAAIALTGAQGTMDTARVSMDLHGGADPTQSARHLNHDNLDNASDSSDVVKAEKERRLRPRSMP